MVGHLFPLRRFILGSGDNSEDHEFCVSGGDVQLWRVPPSGCSACLAAWSHTHAHTVPLPSLPGALASSLSPARWGLAG